MELTSKQAAFVAEVVSGATLTAAYRAAYDADDMAPESVRVEACRLARNPNVALALDEGRRAALDDAVESSACNQSHDSRERCRLCGDSGR